jgi:hypothetical protein
MDVPHESLSPGQQHGPGLGATACGAWVRQQEEALAEHGWVVEEQAQQQVEQHYLLKLEFCFD